MLDLTQLKPGDLITNLEKTYVHLILKLISKVDKYLTDEDTEVETADVLVLNERGNIEVDVLYSDLDQLATQD